MIGRFFELLDSRWGKILFAMGFFVLFLVMRKINRLDLFATIFVSLWLLGWMSGFASVWRSDPEFVPYQAPGYYKSKLEERVFSIIGTSVILAFAGLAVSRYFLHWQFPSWFFVPPFVVFLLTGIAGHFIKEIRIPSDLNTGQNGHRSILRQLAIVVAAFALMIAGTFAGLNIVGEQSGWMPLFLWGWAPVFGLVYLLAQLRNFVPDGPPHYLKTKSDLVRKFGWPLLFLAGVIGAVGLLISQTSFGILLGLATLILVFPLLIVSSFRWNRRIKRNRQRMAEEYLNLANSPSDE